MTVLSLFVDVLGPVVLLVAVGAFAGPRLGIAASSLSPLAYWVLGPAFVFNLFAASGLEAGTVARLVAAGMAGMAVAMILAFLGNRAVGSSRSITAASVITSGYGNVGNAGLAITVFALGDDALAAAGVLMLTINVLGVTIGAGLAAGQSLGPLGALKRAVLAPMTVAAILAILLNLANTSVPLVAERSIGLLAGALIPVMLFTLGLQLVTVGVSAPSPDISISIAAKLVAAPLGAAAAAVLLGLEGDLLGAVVIQSAMPPAVFCMLLAIEHDLEPERVTSSVVTSTAFSLVTLPIVLLLTQP